MKRIRQWLLTAFVAILLLLPLASVASADPNDGGEPTATSYTGTAKKSPTTWPIPTALDPSDGGEPTP